MTQEYFDVYYRSSIGDKWVLLGRVSRESVVRETKLALDLLEEPIAVVYHKGNLASVRIFHPK